MKGGVKTWIFIIAGLLAVILVLANWDAIRALFVRNINAANESKDADALIKKLGATGGGSNTGGTGSTSATLGVDVLLQKGIKGVEVKGLQALCNTIQPGPSGLLTVDGNFGPLTEAKVLACFGVKAITLRNAVNHYKFLNPLWATLLPGGLAKTTLASIP